jgi:hypothetical protein
MMTIRAQFLQQDDNDKPTFAEPFTVKFTHGWIAIDAFNLVPQKDYPTCIVYTCHALTYKSQ